MIQTRLQVCLLKTAVEAKEKIHALQMWECLHFFFFLGEFLSQHKESIIPQLFVVL